MMRTYTQPVRFIIAGAVAALALGCQQPAKPISTRPLPENAPTITIRFERVWSGFDDTRLTTLLNTASVLFAEQGVRLAVTEVVPLNKPEWESIEPEDLPAIRNHTGNPITTIYLVHTAAFGGAAVGGLAYQRPTNAVIIAYRSCPDVLAHEIAHTFGLPHVEGNPCNVLRGSACCGGGHFDESQGIVLRAGASDKSITARRIGVDAEPFVCGQP